VPAVANDTTPIAFIVDLNDQGPKIRLAIREEPVTVGRDPSNDVCMTDDLVSRFHCKIRVTEAGLVIEDLSSSNGTYLGGQRITGSVPLPVPSELTLGNTRLAVVPVPQAAEPVGTVLDPSTHRPSSVILPALSTFTVQTESLLVADIIDSTGLLARSEVNFARAILALGQLIQRGLQDEEVPFLQCTGDGFFACFRDAEVALNVAARLGPGLARHVEPGIHVAVALHWGPTRNTGNGGKAGKDVYAVFSLEKVRHLSPELEAASKAPGSESFIVMTEAFCNQLGPARRAGAHVVGAYWLRGLDDAVPVLHWEPRDEGDDTANRPVS
jgi:pSer/pThr/pTyr-binding forkhead associated (FHA) protein